MVRLPSLSLASPRLSRQLSLDKDLILLDLEPPPPPCPPVTNDLQIVDVEDVDSDSSSEGGSGMESPAKPRVKSWQRRQNSSDSLCVDGNKREIDVRIPPDNRPKSSLRRAQSTKVDRSPSYAKGGNNLSRKTKECEFPVTKRPDEPSSAKVDDSNVTKNVNSLFGGRTPKKDSKNKKEKVKDESPWGDFEDYIRNIDLDTMHFQTKPFANTSSGQFQEVMTEMRNEVDTRNTRKANLKNSLKMSIKFHGFKKNMAELKEAVQKSEQETKKKPKQQKKAPQGPKSRGWRILRAYLQEMRLEKQKNRNMGGWNFLTKTMKNLTDQEKARQDLYDKYLYKPNAWMDGFSTLPQILQDRMKARAENPTYYKPRQKERPHTAVGLMDPRSSPGTTSAHSIPQINHTRKRRQSRSAVNRRPLNSVGC